MFDHSNFPTKALVRTNYHFCEASPRTKKPASCCNEIWPVPAATGSLVKQRSRRGKGLHAISQLVRGLEYERGKGKHAGALPGLGTHSARGGGSWSPVCSAWGRRSRSPSARCKRSHRPSLRRPRTPPPALWRRMANVDEEQGARRKEFSTQHKFPRSPTHIHTPTTRRARPLRSSAGKTGVVAT